MNTEILSLTTEIAGLQKRYEEKCIEKVAMKSKDEEDTAQQSRKVKELSSLVMALDNLERVFTERKETTLRYTYKNVSQGVKDRSKEDEFKINQALPVALAQLDTFSLYLRMYRNIVDGFDGELEE